MNRIRLTERSKKAADDNTPFPGTVGNEDRKDPKSDQYHTFEHVVNHELPDMRTEWKDNARDEIGFGIPKVAHIYATAQKAVKLATLFLGDKCNDKQIEAQARDFMRLGSRRIELALKRFAETETLYKEAEDAANEGAEIQKVSPETAEAQKVVKAEEAKEEKKEEVKAEDKKEEAKEEKKEEKVEAKKEVKAEAAAEVKAEEKDEEVKEDEVKAEDDKEEKDEEKTADDDADEEIPVEEKEDAEVEAEEEIDMTPTDEDVEATEEDIEKLSSVFADDDADEDDKEVVKEASKKQGVKKLGGVAKTASKNVSDKLSSIWNDAPDVSEVF